MKKVLVLLVSIVFLATTAHADLLCAKKNVKANKKGRVKFASSIQATTASSCPKGFNPIFDSEASTAAQGQIGPQGPQGPTGPQGAQGPKGDPGLLNIFQCRFVVESSVIPGGNDFGDVFVPCTQNEFLLTHAGSASDINVDIVSTVLTGFGGEPFASGVEYYFGRNNVGSLANVGISASGICCPR